MDSFYNKHLLPEVSAGIKASVLEEADQFLGMSMTYSLFEYVKENFDSLLENQPDFVENISEKVEKIALDDVENSEKVIWFLFHFHKIFSSLPKRIYDGDFWEQESITFSSFSFQRRSFKFYKLLPQLSAKV